MSFLSSEQKNHLKFLTDQPKELLPEFCKMAMELITEGGNEKKYEIAAKKLNTEPETIQDSVSALASLLIECVTGKINQNEFQTLNSNFSDEQVATLWNFVSNKNESLQLKHSSSDLRFRSLEWRLEARVASRSLLTQAVPKIKIKLHMDSESSHQHRESLLDNKQNKNSTKKEILLETSPSSLSHIIKVLEQAQVEAKTHRTRNFVKAFQ